MSASCLTHRARPARAYIPLLVAVVFAMATYWLSRRDQRAARKHRESIPDSDVSDDIVLEDDLDPDLKKPITPVEPTVLATLEHRHPAGHVAA